MDGNKDNRVENKYKAKKKKIPHLYEHRSKIDSKTTKLLSKRKKKLKSIFFFLMKVNMKFKFISLQFDWDDFMNYKKIK